MCPGCFLVNVNDVKNSLLKIKVFRYELSCYGEICRLWIDRTLHALVKRETVWNSTELRNISEGPQQPSLFEIPDGSSLENIDGIIQPSYPQ